MKAQFHHSLSDYLQRAWDWPLLSAKALSRHEKKSLKTSAEYGATIGCMIAGIICYIYKFMTEIVVLISVVSVIAGYYIGSVFWKLLRE